MCMHAYTYTITHRTIPVLTGPPLQRDAEDGTSSPSPLQYIASPCGPAPSKGPATPSQYLPRVKMAHVLSSQALS